MKNNSWFAHILTTLVLLFTILGYGYILADNLEEVFKNPFDSAKLSFVWKSLNPPAGRVAIPLGVGEVLMASPFWM